MLENEALEEENYDKIFVTLRIYTGEINPNEVTNILGIKPSEIIIKNEKKINGWFLSSEDKIIQLEFEKHLDWLLNIIYPKKQEILELIKNGFKIDISCFYSFEEEFKQTILEPKQMAKMAELGIDFWFDVYTMFRD
jgi:hypothetical protein